MCLLRVLLFLREIMEFSRKGIIKIMKKLNWIKTRFCVPWFSICQSLTLDAAEKKKRIWGIGSPAYLDVFYKFHLHPPGNKEVCTLFPLVFWNNIARLLMFGIWGRCNSREAGPSVCVFVLLSVTCKSTAILHVTLAITEHWALKATVCWCSRSWAGHYSSKKTVLWLYAGHCCCTLCNT